MEKHTKSGSKGQVTGSDLRLIAWGKPTDQPGWASLQGCCRGGCSLEPAGDIWMFLMRLEAGCGQQRIGEGNRLARGQCKARDEQEILDRLLRRGAAIQLDCDTAVAVWRDIPAGDGEQGFVVVGRHTGSWVGCLSRNITIARTEHLIPSGCGPVARAPNKKAPHCGDSAGRGKWQKDVRRTERRLSNEHGQVTWYMLGKKIAPCGGEISRGKHGRSTLQLHLDPRQVYGAAQVTRVLRSQKNAPACHGSRGINIHITESIQRQHTLPKKTLQLSWVMRDGPYVEGRLKPRANGGYTVGAAAKSAAGIETPKITLEPTHAPIAWFFVGTRLPFTWVLLAYPAAGIYSVMVARAGQPTGWSVSKVADSLNPVRATTMRLRPQVGSDNLSTLEAAIMATVPTLVTPVVQLIDGQVVTTSLDLAACFGKQHNNVLAKIQTLDCSPQFTELNFKLSTYLDHSGRELPCYLLTRDGFCFVAMGFTGQRAAEFKETYIAAFNAMEQQLREEEVGLPERQALQQAVAVTLQQLAVIRQVWDEQIYDGLKALGSPLAVALHDRVHMACWSMQTIAKHSGCELTMADALAQTRPPVFPRSQACGLRAATVGSKPSKGGRHE